MSLTSFREAIAHTPQTSDQSSVRQASRDMTMAFSPLLRETIREKQAELVVRPQNKAQVLEIAAAAAKARVPLLPRGAGTGNWGQGIPMAGGAVVDMTALTKISWISDRKLRAEPGVIMADLDRAAQQQGLELRMHPSTRATATIGGYIAGGHVGIGSCKWGILRDPGNVLGVEVVSVEETPRVIELRGTDVNFVHHAYGTNGLITEVELPLATAYRWREVIVEFDEFMTAVRFADALGNCDGIAFKLVAVNEWPYPSFFKELVPYETEGRHNVLVMVADEFAEAFEALVAAHSGHISYQGLEGKGPFGRPLYEFAFGHARLHATRADPNVVANIGVFPHQDLVGSIERVWKKLRHMGPFHFDMKRLDGHLTMQGSPLFTFVDAAQLGRVIEAMQEEGVQSANTHTMHVRENGMKPITDRELAFKKAMDPLGLLNPGKFSADELEAPNEGAALPTTGFSFRATA